MVGENNDRSFPVAGDKNQQRKYVCEREREPEIKNMKQNKSSKTCRLDTSADPF